jgi:hypothetical protein
MTNQDAGDASQSAHARVVFISYRHIDDDPPPENPNGGYVTHLRSQLRWELNRLGVPEAILWRDRYKLQAGDVWSDVLKEELRKADLFIALLSRNYIHGDWCSTELATMASHVAQLDEGARQRRIFRVDKHLVPDEKIHEILRNVQAVRFYEHDKELNREEEFYYRGEVPEGMKRKYFGAIRELAEAIHQRLEELGVEMAPQAPPLTFAKPQSNGRTVFVAKPAKDMVSEYQALTAELTRSGYRVVPDPGADLPETGEEAQAVIESGLAEAELSIHLLGERTGIRPDGLDADIVPYQLDCAAAEARKRPAFYRMIWAPKVLPVRSGDGREVAQRDPFKTLVMFSTKVPTDQVDSDTATRFNQFVFQRLEKKPAATTATTPAKSKTLYLHCAHSDRAFALATAKAIKAAGYSPIVRPGPAEGTPEEVDAAELTSIAKAQRVLLCWGSATRLALLGEIGNPALAKWRAEDPAARSIVLLIGPPATEAKKEVVELGLGEEIGKIVDLMEQSDIASALIANLE